MQPAPVEGRRRPFGLRGWLIVGAVLVVILLLSLRGLARFYTDYLWFKDVGFAHTWRSLLSAKIVPAVIFSVIFFVVMLVNLIVADRVAPRYRGTGPEDEIIERYRGYVAPYAGRVRVLVSLFFAIVMGSGVSAQWQNWILFSNSTSFGIKDAQFHKDISFYVFRLPFLQFAAGWTFAALLVVLIVSAVFHYLNGGIRLQSPFQRVTPQVKVHLSVLLAVMALTKTYQYYLAQFALTKSHNGFVDGATYTDVHAHLPALRLLIVISIAAAGLFIVNIWRRGWVFPIIAVGLWGFISIVVGTIYPAVIQKFQVQPNELSRETPYIKLNIAATRDAFGLANISTKTFNYSQGLAKSATAAAQTSTIDNVRLYDPLPAQDAFKTTQEFTPFYQFSDVDVDRYTIGDESAKPILASVRELDQAHLPDNSWTSQHLVYTHGYGAVAAAANEVNGDQPSYVLSNIPPTGNLKIDPKYTGVYFGEGIGGYAVVDTKVAEQEVTTGGSTKTTTYQGKAGVKVSSLLRKAALALRFGDWNLLVSGQVTDQSRVIYIRDIMQRVKTIAPFLKFDSDPYPVVVGNRIQWVLDAYTTTNDYPYSQSIHPDEPPGSGLDTDFNYVRNSVKATIDAYDGTVHFYVVDPNDPIVKTYRKAFPEVFEDLSAMPADLRAHMRYPEDIFSAQTEQYALYHITDPVQFFNKQAIWDVAPSPDTSSAAPVASAVAGGNNGGRNTTLPSAGSPIKPLYLTLGLPPDPGQRTPSPPQFVLERSFTPRLKGGILSAFVFAQSDGADYGKLVVYQVPNTAAPSPGQAATLIQSDQFISTQFTLLGSAGSRVIQGDVQLLPIGNAIMYVRPIWILGEGSSTFPRYRFVAAAVDQRAVLGFNMEDDIQALLSGNPTQLQTSGGVKSNGSTPTSQTGTSSTTTTLPGSPTTVPPGNASVAALLAKADSEFALADAALTAGQLGEYQLHNRNAQADVAAAQAKLNATGSTATTVPAAGKTSDSTVAGGVTTTTGAP
ncbi:MAG TPA: UPF0182 family protein [Acidimicrobiia bacterium]|nr:UPF0182 family protein [Acidimicrobiia bacterium]